MNGGATIIVNGIIESMSRFSVGGKEDGILKCQCQH